MGFVCVSSVDGYIVIQCNQHAFLCVFLRVLKSSELKALVYFFYVVTNVSTAPNSFSVSKEKLWARCAVASGRSHL